MSKWRVTYNGRSTGYHELSPEFIEQMKQLIPGALFERAPVAENEIVRLYSEDLQTITYNCELCDKPVKDHSWVDMDGNTNVVYCSVWAFKDRMKVEGRLL